jgi:hypothetical protein
MRKPITVLSILVVAAMTLGGAVAEHFERRAQHDRFSFGDAEYITAPAQ